MIQTFSPALEHYEMITVIKTKIIVHVIAKFRYKFEEGINVADMTALAEDRYDEF